MPVPQCDCSCHLWADGEGGSGDVVLPRLLLAVHPHHDLLIIAHLDREIIIIMSNEQTQIA